MNVDRVLDVLNRRAVAYLLAGGMNYLLRHEPILTYDIDIWVQDNPENLLRCEAALADLDASWGRTETEWGPVSKRSPGWLGTQAVYCLTSPHGSIDIFRSMAGLGSWSESRRNAVAGKTASTVPYLGLSDADMLRCQLALDEKDRKLDRIRRLQSIQAGEPNG